jgi:hypothetical protein
MLSKHREFSENDIIFILADIFKVLKNGVCHVQILMTRPVHF